MKLALQLFGTLMLGGSGGAFLWQAIAADGMAVAGRIGLGATAVLIAGTGLTIVWDPTLLRRIGRGRS